MSPLTHDKDSSLVEVEASPAKSASVSSKDETKQSSGAKVSALPATKTSSPEAASAERVSEEQSSSSSLAMPAVSAKTASVEAKAAAEKVVADAKADDDKDSPGVKLTSLSNRLFLSTGLDISVSMESASRSSGAEQGHSDKDPPNHEAIPEFRSLLRQMALGEEEGTSSGDFVLKLQESLGLIQRRHEEEEAVLNLHVGHGKSTIIDLPTSRGLLDISTEKDKANHVKVMFCSESDGIEGQALRAESPTAQLASDNRRTPTKKLKKKEHGQTDVNAHQTNLAEVHAPYRFSPPRDQEQPQSNPPVQHNPSSTMMSDAPLMGLTPYYLHYFSHPRNVAMLRHQIESMMAGYVFPEEWRLLGIDPVVAMLVGKRMDQREDPDAIAGLMEKYAMWVNYEYMVRVRQQQQREQQLEHPQQVEQPQGLQANQNQTYTELQTVRGSSDATEVLQSHNRRQEQEEQPQVVESSEAEDSVSVPSVESAEISRDARMRVKEEVVEVPSVSSPLAEPRSVIPTSVLPAPPSVAEIPRNMPGLGTIGVKGEKRVLVSYEGCAVGPIRVETEDQVRAILSYVKEKVKASKHRGQSLTTAPVYCAAAVRAKSILPKDVVAYLDKAFTKRALKQNVVGRKRRNYPKRSQIIKVPANSIKCEVEAPSEADVQQRNSAEPKAPENSSQRSRALNNTERDLDNMLISLDSSGSGNNIDLDTSTDSTSNTVQLVLPGSGDMDVDVEPDEVKEKKKMSRLQGLVKPTYKKDGGEKNSRMTSRQQHVSQLKPMSSYFEIKSGKTYKGIGIKGKDRKDEKKDASAPTAPTAPTSLNISKAEIEQRKIRREEEKVRQKLAAATARMQQQRHKEGRKQDCLFTKAVDIMTAGMDSSPAAQQHQPGSSNGKSVSDSKATKKRPSTRVDDLAESNALTSFSSVTTRQRAKVLKALDAPKITYEKDLHNLKRLDTMFVRSGQEERLKKLFKKKELKMQRVQKKKAGKTYKGFGSAQKEEKSQSGRATFSRRASVFKPSEGLEGARKVLRADGAVVELPSQDPPLMKSPSNAQSSHQPAGESSGEVPKKKGVPINKEESDLLEELFTVALGSPAHTEQHQEMCSTMSFGFDPTILDEPTKATSTCWSLEDLL